MKLIMFIALMLLSLFVVHSNQQPELTDPTTYGINVLKIIIKVIEEGYFLTSNQIKTET